jgi:lysozyme family protein
MLNDAQVKDFEEFLVMLLELEGGYTVDDGGSTMYGVTQSEYSAYRVSKGLKGFNSVNNISMDQVRDIYLNNYWIPSHACDLASPLSWVHGNLAVNGGLSRAMETLNQVFLFNGNSWNINIPAESKINTLQKCSRYLDINADFYRSLAKNDPAKYEVYLAGWLNRIEIVRKKVGV